MTSITSHHYVHRLQYNYKEMCTSSLLSHIYSVLCMLFDTHTKGALSTLRCFWKKCPKRCHCSFEPCFHPHCLGDGIGRQHRWHCHMQWIILAKYYWVYSRRGQWDDLLSCCCWDYKCNEVLKHNKHDFETVGSQKSCLCCFSVPCSCCIVAVYSHTVNQFCRLVMSIK